VAERRQPAVAEQQVDARREHRKDHDLAREVHVVLARGERHERREHDEGERRLHAANLPKRPRGRKAMTRIIGRKRITYARSGRSATPNVYTKPVMNAPTKAPSRLPTPPRITTMSASGSMSASSPGYADMIGPPITPPAPASAAPRQNTVVKRRDTGMPTALAISGSSTPARIIAPKRVRSISRYNAMATPMAI